MRLIVIPIARARPGVTPVSTFLAQKTPIKPSFVAHKAVGSSAPAASSSSSKGKEAATGTAAGEETAEKPPLTKRIMDRAAQFWIDLGREDQTSTFDWKRRTYTLGERLMDRIEYEEWALKGVDPALGPSLSHPTGNQVKREESQATADAPATAAPSTSKLPTVSLLYPPRHLDGSTILASIDRLTRARQPHHRQRMIWCLVGMPITAPFALVPVIPNLPFFYLVWRAWSHWRAYQSSKYLSSLIERDMIVPQASDELDRILALPAPPAADAVSQSSPTPTTAAEATAQAVASASATSQAGTTTGASSSATTEQVSEEEKQRTAAADAKVEELLILKPYHITTLAKTFNMDRQLSVDLTRARLQTIKAIKDGQMDKIEAAAGHGQKAQ